jgi:biotin operon repressor
VQFNLKELQQVVKLWNEGWSGPDIGELIGVSHARVLGMVAHLRRGGESVPYRTKRSDGHRLPGQRIESRGVARARAARMGVNGSPPEIANQPAGLLAEQDARMAVYDEALGHNKPMVANLKDTLSAMRVVITQETGELDQAFQRLAKALEGLRALEDLANNMSEADSAIVSVRRLADEVGKLLQENAR